MDGMHIARLTLNCRSNAIKTYELWLECVCACKLSCCDGSNLLAAPAIRFDPVRGYSNCTEAAALDSSLVEHCSRQHKITMLMY